MASEPGSKACDKYYKEFIKLSKKSDIVQHCIDMSGGLTVAYFNALHSSGEDFRKFAKRESLEEMRR